MFVREVPYVASIMLATAMPSAESKERANPVARVFDIPAWTRNEDPQGVAVRAGPTDSPIRIRLPSTADLLAAAYPCVEDGVRGVRFIEHTIASAASNDGWMPW
jgi:hypothetical protein